MTPSGQTVCLCMIVKDEAPVIRRCLDSVRALIDHWVIVDTGSTDGTQEIVREHFRDVPGELVERPWQDFAHNRSEALALARPRGDYSLIIDADDAFEVPPDYRLPDLDADSYMVDIHFGDARYSRPQLVKAALVWRYEGVIHEYLACDRAATSGHLPLVMRIHQDGARRRDPDTYRKDAAVLERAVAEETDPFKLARYTFYLAQSYRDSGQGGRALPLYLRRADLGFWDQEVYVSLLYAGRISEGLGRPAGEALAAYRRAIDVCPMRAEAYHAAARLLRGQRRFVEGCALARTAIDLAPPHLGLFIESWIYDYGMLDEFSVNAYWSDHNRDSLDASLRALKRGKVPPEQLGHFLDNMRFALDRVLAEAPPETAPPAPAPAVAAPKDAPPEAVRAQGKPAPMPTMINLGSGKDFRDDHLNIDVDATWRPDAVIDLSAVKLGPEGVRLRTRRFGDVVLRPGSTDRIIANDVLEHVPDLVALMTTCLGLLRVGGTFAISVPYDLSFGAWQDPTHVRTFNERSWLYYTDWFWYLGWRDARFVVDAMQHVASPLGAALRERNVPNDEVVRTPRAIDSMAVTLRKAILTLDDRKVLEHWRDRQRAAEARDDQAVPQGSSEEFPPDDTPPPVAFSGPWSDARDAFCLWIVSPPGYEHSSVFDDVGAVLSEAFTALGGSAPVVRSPDDWRGRTPIVLGAHLLSAADAAALPRDAVLFNFEQVDAGSAWMSPLYLSLLARHAVLDYSVGNTRALKAKGIAHARHLSIRAMPRPTPAVHGDGRDIDVLFYGSMNDRRARVIEALKARGLAVTHLFGVYGAERNAAIARAKVVINIHFYEAAVFESARVCHLLSLGACVVSEGRLDDPDTMDLGDGLVLCTIEEIVDRCAALVGDPAKRDAQARHGLATIARRSQADILAAAFECPAQAAAPPAAEAPPPPTASRSGAKSAEEDAFLALLGAGRLLEQRGEPFDTVLATYERATEVCPWRAEALHAASRLCRFAGQNAPGAAFGRRASEVPMPAAGRDVEAWIYEWGALDEFIINSYWAGDDRASLDALMRALASGKVPEAERPRFLANAGFALARLGASKPPATTAAQSEAAAHALVPPRDLQVTPPDPAPRVLLAILAKQKEPVLPFFLRCIEALDYPKSSIVIYIRTNNNTDRTKQILEDWVARVGPLYAAVEFDGADVDVKVEEFGVHEWNVTRFRVLNHIRDVSLSKTAEHGCDFYFTTDCDNFVRPCTLRNLVALDLPVVAPLLRHLNPSLMYSNFHAAVDAEGFFADSDIYAPVLYRQVTGLIELPVVHCTYLVRADVIPRVGYNDGSDRYDYIIFSDRLRKEGIPQYFDNRQVYGYLTLDDHLPEVIAGQLERAERLMEGR